MSLDRLPDLELPDHTGERRRPSDLVAGPFVERYAGQAWPADRFA